jgi:hypothetical protein
MVIEIEGRLEFEPENFTRKHENQSAWKRVAMIRTDCDLHLYYAWFLRKRFNLELNKPIRGSHVTFISDRFEDRKIFDEVAKMFNGKPVTFYLELEPRSNGEHWWLRAYSPDTENIRHILGLSREPYFSLHFTLGYANEKNMAHSHYIMEQCKRFELIDSSLRKPLEEHEILNFNSSRI